MKGTLQAAVALLLSLLLADRIHSVCGVDPMWLRFTLVAQPLRQQ